VNIYTVIEQTIEKEQAEREKRTELVAALQEKYVRELWPDFQQILDGAIPAEVREMLGLGLEIDGGFKFYIKGTYKGIHETITFRLYHSGARSEEWRLSFGGNRLRIHECPHCLPPRGASPPRGLLHRG